MWLDPYLGFLHSAGDSYESLVCDLEEAFRPMVDRHLVTAINKKVVQAKDFVKLAHKKEKLYLTPEARRSFLRFYATCLDLPWGQHEFSQMQLMELQVKRVREWVLERASFELIRTNSLKESAENSQETL
jgi:CRISPR-associated protein Cas1